MRFGSGKVREDEPNISDEVVAVPVFSDNRNCQSVGISNCAGETAALNGVEFKFNAPCINITKDGDVYTVETPEGNVEAKYIRKQQAYMRML